MPTCPSCQSVFVLPPVGGRCTQCGAPVAAEIPSVRPPASPPGPYAPAFASPAATPAATVVDDGYIVRVAALPRRAPAQPTTRPVPLGVILGTAALLLLGLGGWWMTRGSGGDDATGAGDPNAMVVLPDIGEDGGLTPIGDALRVGAEANARQAFTATQQVFAEYGSYREVTPELLAQYQPELAWLPGHVPASDRDQVSVAVTGDTGIVIAASDGGDVCVFARDDGTGIGGDFVAVRTTAGCRADAPPDP